MGSRPYVHDDLALALALAALGAVAFAFLVAGNGAAFVMAGLCLGGVVAGRLVGVNGRTLLPVGVGLALVMWMLWNYPVGPGANSAIAHLSGGALAGWALAVTLRRSISWPGWGLLALGGVVVLAGVWEIAEWAGDRALDTGLVPSKRDSAFDVFCGIVGAVPGIAIARWAELRR